MARDTNHTGNDVVLGQSLAETAALNNPEHIAGVEAAAVVQRTSVGGERALRNQRRFRVVLLVLLAAVAALLFLVQGA